jgi:hypothetical protein
MKSLYTLEVIRINSSMFILDLSDYKQSIYFVVRCQILSKVIIIRWFNVTSVQMKVALSHRADLLRKEGGCCVKQTVVTLQRQFISYN